MKRLKKISFLRILFSSTSSRNAEIKILIGYVFYAMAGALLLMLPFSTKGCIPFVDNLFNATSALSTTGLATVPMGQYTLFGQLILLGLIQIGGLGFMTLSSYILLASFHHIFPDNKNILNISLTRPANFTIKELIQTIIIFTFSIEIVGAMILSVCFAMEGTPNYVWQGIFHSISSFCTAGFSLFPDSLEQFKFNTPINMTIAILSYLGAIGFIVVLDLWKRVKYKTKITFTSKTILWVTLVMAVFGTMVLFFTERSFKEFSFGNRLLVSFFQTMSSMTTVGFNSVNMSLVSTGGLMTIILLMIIGASPSGTGGGLKSTTIPAIIGLLKSKINNEEKVTIWGHTIPKNRVNSALSTFILYTVTLFFGIYLLSFFEPYDLTNLFFEASSALGTVGLSTGITFQLSVAGKIILTALMLIGRVGVLTVGAIFLHLNAHKKELNNHCKETDLAV